MVEALVRRFCIYENEYIKMLQEIELLVPDGFEVEDVSGLKDISRWETKKLVDVDFDEKYSNFLVSNSKIALYVPVPTNIVLAKTDEIARKYARGAAALELIPDTINRLTDPELANLLVEKLKEEYDSFYEFKRKLSEEM